MKQVLPRLKRPQAPAWSQEPRASALAWEERPRAAGRSTRCRVDSSWTLYDWTVLASCSCLPAKIRRCCSDGMPSCSSILLLTCLMVSDGSTCSSMALPASVFAVILRLLLGGASTRGTRYSIAGGASSLAPLVRTSARSLVSSNCCPAWIRRCWSGARPVSAWILSLTSDTASPSSTSISMTFPVKVLTMTTLRRGPAFAPGGDVSPRGDEGTPASAASAASAAFAAGRGPPSAPSSSLSTR
mmetsp:Transcript_25978/g.57264  ORF Transcript_25978/g.57264 Transcript_25978/m.57264 type:complete len:243 (+) Transcript_25978:1837-2565(+)